MDYSLSGSSVHEFPKQEHWSGLSFPSPGDLPNLGIKLTSPAWQADSLPLSHQGSPFCGMPARVLCHVETLCDLTDCSPTGSSVHGLFQAITLEGVAISYSRKSFQLRDWTCVSCIGRWVGLILGLPTNKVYFSTDSHIPSIHYFT